MKNIRILNVLYPQSCGICGKIGYDGLCNKCELNIKNQNESKIDDYREDKEKYFSNHIYLFKYEGIIRTRLIDYKFNDKAYLYKTFSKILEKDENLYVQIKKYDIIIPVPISKKRFKQRGYNQCELVAKSIAKMAKNRYENKILKKQKNNQVQSGLDKIDRELNVKNVYKLRNNEINLENAKILLVDDIYTTGSTVNECCKILVEDGNAKKENIDVFTIAKDFIKENN